MRKGAVDIIIPTFNNAEQLFDCVQSILLTVPRFSDFRIIVVNNGTPEINDQPELKNERIIITQAPHNLGWEAGLILGLEKSDAEFVVFQNDDTYIPEFSRGWLKRMVSRFVDPKLGALGPCTNVVMGEQNIFANRLKRRDDLFYPLSFIIGFCAMFRRSALDEAGGIDDTLPGGDDLDFSIRLIDAGYTVAMDKSVFVWHHGFQTGERVHGRSDRPSGWNSQQMTDNTNMALIKKHGLKRWYDCLYKQTAPALAEEEK